VAVLEGLELFVGNALADPELERAADRSCTSLKRSERRKVMLTWLATWKRRLF